VDAIVRDLSTTAVVPALEANMVVFWTAYSRAPGGELYEGDDLVRVVTGVSEPLFNGVFRARLIPSAVDSAIATTLAHVAQRRVPMFCMTCRSQDIRDDHLHCARGSSFHIACTAL
jgi:hypothetical protein